MLTARRGPIQRRAGSRGFPGGLRHAPRWYLLHPFLVAAYPDEGPWPDRFRANNDGFQGMDTTRDELDEKLAILNAYHLPGVSPEAAGLYPAITPVNSFRVVLNVLFGADLPLLPDRYYAQVDSLHFYDLFDVTERLRN